MVEGGSRGALLALCRGPSIRRYEIVSSLAEWVVLSEAGWCDKHWRVENVWTLPKTYSQTEGWFAQQNRLVVDAEERRVRNGAGGDDD
jgi:hypothetical protein